MLIDPRRWDRRRLLATIVVAVVVAAVAGWGASRLWHGTKSDALYAIGSTHELCAPVGRARGVTEGFDGFANRGPAPVTIDRVEWPTTGDLEVRSIRVFQRQPGDRFAALGLWRGLPPDNLDPNFRRAWVRGEPAEGATLPVAGPGEDYLLFTVGVRGTQGTGGPLTLHYTDADGHTGTVSSLVELRIAPKSCSGPPRR
ncbi:hypothetical protein [Nocardioides sp.]|uniref:hypothetical protein n=1 Tax=Nocardioides sp. TaxID=35761 RepID=UPI002ED78CAD